jgi:hypothetical protein
MDADGLFYLFLDADNEPKKKIRSRHRVENRERDGGFRDADEILIERQKERAEQDVPHKAYQGQKEGVTRAIFFPEGTVGQDITQP